MATYLNYIKAPKRIAVELRKALNEGMFLDKQSRIIHSSSYVYFPVVVSKPNIKKLAVGYGCTIVEKREVPTERRESFDAMLLKTLGRKEYSLMIRGYDLLGDIAVLDIPDKLKKKEKLIARLLIKAEPNVKKVVKKAGAVSGKFRTRKFIHLIGKRSYIAEYRENGCMFRFDIRRSFFSNRLSFERSRILSQIKDREHVLVMFAGVGPFTIEIAKAYPKTEVIGIELNKNAYNYMNDNIAINKVKNARAMNADVSRLPKELKSFADRIIVPMPTSSLKYLDSIFFAAKPKCTVHLYAFGSRENGFDEVYNKIKEHAGTNRYKARPLFHREVRPYSYNEIELVIDYILRKSTG